MRMIGHLLFLFARGLKQVEMFFHHVGNVVEGLLPVLLPPTDLARRSRQGYDRAYSPRVLRSTQGPEDYQLDEWEADVVERYRIRSGHALILGSGYGREAIALASRGLRVDGVDTNYPAVRTAQQKAKACGLPARFCQADLLALPYTAESFDVAVLWGNIYSAIPGRAHRVAFLAGLRRHLKPEGFVILDFIREARPVSRAKALSTTMNRLLVKLPGANRAYEPGDECRNGLFFHWFQEEEEIQRELADAGTRVLELNWGREFAVVAYSLQQGVRGLSPDRTAATR